jgi:hypothetical protein
LTPFQHTLLQVTDSLTKAEQYAVFKFSPQDIHRLKELIREIAAQHQAESFKARQNEAVIPKDHSAAAVRTASTKTPLKKQPPRRKCPHCKAMVRIDYMANHREEVHAKPQKAKRLKGKQLRVRRLKGAGQTRFKKSGTPTSKSIRVVQGGLCSGK